MTGLASMKIMRAYKYRLYPTADQESRLSAWVVAARAGDEELARCLAVRGGGGGEIAVEIEKGGGKSRVRWDANRIISLLNTD